MTASFSYRNFSYNANGQIIAKAEKRFGDSAYKTQRYYYSPTGGELGSFGAFGNNARPIDAVISGGSTPSAYTVNGGDTLMGIAATLWGDSKLWYLIADANGLNMGPTDAFSAGDVGRNLRIPNTDKVVGNTSSNWKPYNPNEKIGDLTPNPSILPPPKKKGCGVVAMIIMVAIAVVLTVVTAGAAAAGMGATVASTGTAATMSTVWAAGSAALTGGLAGTAIGGVAAGMAAAAVGGFVGSVGSQLAGKAMGVVESFSLRQAVGSGLTAGFAAGAGSALQGAGWASKAVEGGAKVTTAAGNMARGAAGYLGSYASNKIVGLDTSFNWTDMAVASVSAGITGKTGGVSDIGNSAGEFGRNFIGNMWGSTASSSLSRLMGRGQKQDWGAMAADAFGNALGQKVVDRLTIKPKAPLLMDQKAAAQQLAADLGISEEDLALYLVNAKDDPDATLAGLSQLAGEALSSRVNGSFRKVGLFDDVLQGASTGAGFIAGAALQVADDVYTLGKGAIALAQFVDELKNDYLGAMVHMASGGRLFESSYERFGEKLHMLDEVSQNLSTIVSSMPKQIADEIMMYHDNGLDAGGRGEHFTSGVMFGRAVMLAVSTAVMVGGLAKLGVNLSKSTTKMISKLADDFTAQSRKADVPNNAARLDYSSSFADDLVNFKPGYQHFSGQLDDDLILVQFHRSDRALGEGRSAAWWTTPEQEMLFKPLMTSVRV